MDNQRNLILAIALSFLLLLGWTSAMDYFYPQPEQALVEDRADTPTEQASQAATLRFLRRHRVLLGSQGKGGSEEAIPCAIQWHRE